jgi:Family of unknown function (DUF5681)
MTNLNGLEPKKTTPDKQVRSRKPNGQFAPGVSGNPNGRPKSRTLSEAYRELLKQPLPSDPTRTYADVVAAALLKNAMSGDVSSARELADRTEGKPRQPVDLSVDDRRRDIAERAIEALMVDAAITRDEAIEELAKLTPELPSWIN